MTHEINWTQDTLRRGAEVFAQWPHTRRKQPQITHSLQSKAIANGLRELDRFLNLLVDAAFRERGEFDNPNQWNTANKLQRFRRDAVGAEDDIGRLVALGRSRNSLFHCGGVARHQDRDDPRLMTLGWTACPGSPLTRISLGGLIVLGSSDFECVGQFYRGLAESVVLQI
jgi:hypothetical protein